MIRFRKKNGNTEEVGECLASLNILGHAQLEQIDLGSQCGGHGICGKDKILIESSSGLVSKLNETEKAHLSSDEIAQGWRLACQCFPQQDGLEITVLCQV